MFACNTSSKLRSCVKVEVAVLGSPTPCGFCGCNATLNRTVKIQINSVGYKCKVKGKRMRLSVLVNKMLPCDFAPHN